MRARAKKEERNMKILLTNDDGFDAPGIIAMARAAKAIGDIYVAAPAEHHSGASHSVSITGALKVQKKHFDGDIEGWKIWGTPYDCCALAIEALMDEKPDLVISGINGGSNVGRDILHSGTIGAGSAAFWSGVPTIAVSLNHRPGVKTFKYDAAAEFAVRAAKWLLAQPDPKAYMLSINVPNVPKEKIAGCVAASMGDRHNYHCDFKKSSDGWFDYYNVTMVPHHAEGNYSLNEDDYAVNHDYIVLTPLGMNVTAYEHMDALDGAANSLWPS
jgi:5'-nucleotidase